MNKENKKIGLLAKEKILGELNESAKDIQGCFFVGFNKVAAFPFNELRNNLRDSGAKVIVAKNTIFKRVISDLGWEGCEEFLASETGMVFVHDEDVVKACKILVEFSKETETLQVKGGVINKKAISGDDVSKMAKIPSRDILLGMAVSSLAAPLTGFLSCLNQIILKFVWTIEEIKKTKSK